jgi:hypothetical protein
MKELSEDDEGVEFVKRRLIEREANHLSCLAGCKAFRLEMGAWRTFE